MSDCYESMSRTTIRDRPLRPPIRHSGGGRNPEGWGEGVVALELVPSLGRTARSRKLQRPTDHHFHTLVCRRKPACAIAMKACPGLRSGIDRSGSLSFAIRGIPSSFRPPIRHSGEGRNPGGVGRGKATRRWKKPNRRPTFIPWCARASRHERLVRNGEKAPAQLPKRRREPPIARLANGAPWLRTSSSGASWSAPARDRPSKPSGRITS